MVTSPLTILSQNPSLAHDAFQRQRNGASVWDQQPLLAPIKRPLPAVNTLCFLLNTAVQCLAEAQVLLTDEGRHPRRRREGAAAEQGPRVVKDSPQLACPRSS